MPDKTGIFLGWSANLSIFWGLGVEAGASPMYPQKMRVPPWDQCADYDRAHVRKTRIRVFSPSSGTCQFKSSGPQKSYWISKRVLYWLRTNRFIPFPKEYSSRFVALSYGAFRSMTVLSASYCVCHVMIRSSRRVRFQNIK